MSGDHGERIAELEQILASVTVVDPPSEPGKGITFGSRVTVRDATGQLKAYRILGVDELDLDPDAVSWISPLGKALLAAELGDRVIVAIPAPAEVVKIEYPATIDGIPTALRAPEDLG